MPLFEYKAVAPSGETVRGTMEAISEDLVISKLQEGGNIPISAHAAGEGGFSLDLLSLKKTGYEHARSRSVYPATVNIAGCRITT